MGKIRTSPDAATLAAYRKESIKADCVQTSVNIRADQHEFLKRGDLNLSRMVRDLIDSLMGKRAP